MIFCRRKFVGVRVRVIEAFAYGMKYRLSTRNTVDY